MKISAATLSLLALDEYTSQQSKNGQSAAISRAHFYDLVYAENKDFLEQCRNDAGLERLEANIGRIFLGKPKEQGEAEKILGAETCKVFKALAKAADGIVSIYDEEFPQIDIPDSVAQDRPFLLFYRGDPTLLDQVDKNIAIVGLVEPEEETRQRIEALVPRLVAEGVNIVSGLAKGCDQAAHEACLRAGGKTIAILPSPLDRVYPRENAKLAREIVKCGGLLLSEYYKPPVEDWEFSNRATSRDRLQAMFACGVILAASHEPDKKSVGQQGKKSGKRQIVDCGARHAMEKARAYKRRRIVLYDANTDGDKACLGLNRQYFDYNQSLLVKDAAFIALADPANDDLGKLLGRLADDNAGEKPAENGAEEKPAENIPEVGDGVNCPECDPAIEDNLDDFCSQIPVDIEEDIEQDETGEYYDSFSYEDASQEEFAEADASQEYEDFLAADENQDAAQGDEALNNPPGARPCKENRSFLIKRAGEPTGLEISSPDAQPREKGRIQENSRPPESPGKKITSNQSLLTLAGLPAKEESRKKAAACAREVKKPPDPANDGQEKRKKGKKRAQIREDQFRLY